MNDKGWFIPLLPIVGVVLNLTFIHASVWLVHRREPVHKWVALWFALSSGFVVTRLVQLTTAGPALVPHLIRLQYGLGLALGLVAVAFTAGLAQAPVPRVLPRVAAVIVPLLLAGLWLLDDGTPMHLTLAIGGPFNAIRPGWMYLVAAAACAALIGRAIFQVATARPLGRRERWLLAGALLLASAAGLHDVLLFRFTLRSVPLLDLGLLAVGLTCSWLLAQGYGQLAGNLEALVARRTHELHERSRELASARDVAEVARLHSDEQAAAIARSEVGLRSLIESSPDGMAVVRAGVVRFANRRFFALLGGDGTPVPPPAPRLVDLVPERCDLLTALTVPRGVDRGPAVEVGFERGDGRAVRYEAAVVATDWEGAPAELIVLRDRTERHELETRLQRSERLASVGTLAAGVAHEINNPLSVVLANATLVDERLAVGAAVGELRTLTAEIITSAGRMKRIVDDLSLLSRPASSVPAPVEPADPRTAVELALRVTRNQLRHRARLTLDCQPTAAVAIDSAELAQALVNVVSNALQAMPEGRAAAHELRVAVRPGGPGSVEIEVRDDGAGIPVEAVPHAFDPFFPARGSTTGPGLGLAIAHSIVTARGGTIELESAEGHGTCVRIALPAAALLVAGDGGGAPTGALAAPAAAVVARSIRVLVVDDEPLVARAVARSLHGHEVEVATSAVAALALLARGAPFDVVLCDLMMPEVTGMELYHQVAHDAPTQAARFVFLTGGAFTEEARRFLDSTAAPRLYKPFHPSDLRRLVEELGAQGALGQPWAAP